MIFKLSLMLGLCMLSGISSASLLEKVYREKDGKIYYGYEASGLMKEVVGSTSEGFKRLGDDYAKDNKHVYQYGRVVLGANPKTFKVWKNLFAKDHKHVYYLGNPILGLNPKKAKIIGLSYIKDKDSVYYSSTKIYEADPKSFKSGDTFMKRNIMRAKDKKNFYSASDVIEVCDKKTFKFKKYLKFLDGDDKCIFFSGKKLDTPTPTRVRSIDGRYYRDDESVFYRGDKVVGADLSSFVPYSMGRTYSYSYAKSDSAVYYNDKVMAGLDPSFFEVSFDVANEAYGKYKDSCYVESVVVDCNKWVDRSNKEYRESVRSKILYKDFGNVVDRFLMLESQGRIGYKISSNPNGEGLNLQNKFYKFYSFLGKGESVGIYFYLVKTDDSINYFEVEYGDLGYLTLAISSSGEVIEYTGDKSIDSVLKTIIEVCGGLSSCPGRDDAVWAEDGFPVHIDAPEIKLIRTM